jgi:hypothetical protein
MQLRRESRARSSERRLGLEIVHKYVSKGVNQGRERRSRAYRFGCVGASATG